MKEGKKIAGTLLFCIIFTSTLLISSIPKNNYIYISDILNGKSYTQTDKFETLYSNKIKYVYDYIRSYIKDTSSVSHWYTENLDDEANSFQYECIISKKDNTVGVLSNIPTSKQDSFINSLKSSDNYYIYDSKTNTSDTAVDYLKYITYDYKIDGTYNIYTKISTDKNGDDIGKYIKEYNDTCIKFKIGMVTIPLAILICIILLIYITISILKEDKKIKESYIDRIPLEILIGIGSLIVFFCIYTWSDNLPVDIDLLYDQPIIASIFFTTVILLVTSIVYTNILKRLKSKNVVKNTLMYHASKETSNVIVNINVVYKYLVISIFVLITNCILGYLIIYNLKIFNTVDIFKLIILALVNLTYMIYISLKIIEYKKIESTLNGISKGDFSKRIDNSSKYFKDISESINNINNGFSSALEEKIKSQKLKTDLITNVSHDIKTPLTSIINYVDLLKNEVNQDKKDKYIEILDNKSQKLKLLIENLIEASKVSSGNIKVNSKNINLSELVIQSNGEFEEKFKEKNLILETCILDKNIILYLDGNLMWRVFENIYINVFKYSMENTRVYVELLQDNESVIFRMKNVSKSKLNITPEELMERFVRGDDSRKTEGSGLGISIAKSLIELQNGKFEIFLDGDLFKVEIKFKK